MKNILKKIGVLGLIIAVLAPFIELPSVNAEASGCENHLQNYLFLDANYIYKKNGKTFFEGYSKDQTAGGYQTYTNFPYSFVDTATNDVTIKSMTINNFNSDTVSNISSFWNSLKDISASLTSYDIDPTIGGVLVKSPQLSNYADTTILLHGVWSSFDENGVAIESDWTEAAKSGSAATSIQTILKSEDLAKLSVAFRPATYVDASFGLSTETLNADYFQKVVNSNYSTWTDSKSERYIPLSITRTIGLSESEIVSMLDDYSFGYLNTEDNSYYVYSTAAFTDGKASSAKDSYTALLNGNNSYKVDSKDDIDFITTNRYYWPAILSVEYVSCPKVSTEWAVRYDDNVEDTSVTNMPDPLTQTETVGTNIKVSSTIPTRDGWVFKGWCETENGSGECYQAGDSVKSPDVATTVPLFAQWQKSGTTENPKQGVVSYIIGFAAVGVVAGGIYLVSKKKNLFKQI